ncbi:S-layer homology domain-containing protein [Paenibacillus agri]|uniref:S-layer homology domain-containing protein n=1 Tax=Paenibacillus agri TaxID=2744309 RepID=A0A850EZC7_9BACL|nr:S-layer homology domain-containing protein [Paenibacillus agri]NUU64302.1 S-layer homology domain-containing protein [Paenibacillus agri]
MNLKKSAFAAMATVTLLSFSLGSQVFAAETSFKDLDSVAGKEKIISLKDQGLIKGVTETSFLPASKVTVAQGVQFIAGGLQLSLAAIDFNIAPTASGLFTNVKDNAWYAEAFINAHYNRVDIPKDVKPSQILTREQFTSMLVQGVEAIGNLPMINIKPADIVDDSQLDPSYQGAVQRSLVYKINTLDSNGKFNPKAEITRAEAAIMVYNAVDFLKFREAAAAE